VQNDNEQQDYHKTKNKEDFTMLETEMTENNGSVSLQRVILGEQASIITYKDYQDAMAKLKNEDISDAFDKDEPALTPQEQELDKYLASCRNTMLNNKYVYAPRNDTAEPTVYPPIRPFYEKDVRAAIEKDPVFKIFKAMPKGGNLHIHTSATLEASVFVNMLCDDTDINGYIAVYLGPDEAKMCTLAYFTKTNLPDPDCGNINIRYQR